jgi:hypothetical protein
MVGILLNSCFRRTVTTYVRAGVLFCRNDDRVRMSYVAGSELLPENTVLRRAQGAMSYKFREVNGNPLESLTAHQTITRRAVSSEQVSGAQVASLAQKILAIPCRTNSTDITKDLRKVLLGLEATGYGHVQYSRIRSTQHRCSTLDPLAQHKLMWGLAR